MYAQKLCFTTGAGALGGRWLLLNNNIPAIVRQALASHPRMAAGLVISLKRKMPHNPLTSIAL